MIVACATDDGVKFVSRHFGDAKQYDIYRIEGDLCEFVKTIGNTTGEEDEEVHADPRKARGIVDLLKKSNVQVGATKVFGPNIKRVVKHFIPVIVSQDEISKGLQALLENHERIEKIIDDNRKDTYIDLKSGKEVRIKG